MSDTRTSDPLSAAARHINGGGPLAAFMAALSDEGLRALDDAAGEERLRRAREREATRCDHPPSPACDSCGGQKAGTLYWDAPGVDRMDGVRHRDDCRARIERARQLTYHPSAGTRRWVENVLDRARRAGAIS